MRVLTALSKYIIVLAVFAGSGMSVAQDAIPETPPELRDFRLDPERTAPKPKAEPTTQPVVVTPPPAVSTIPDRAPDRPRPQPQRQIAEPEAELPPARAPTAEQQPEPAEPVVATEQREVITSEIPPAAKPQASPVPYWQIFVGLALAAMLLLVGFWFKRRRSAADKPVQPLAKTEAVSAADMTPAAAPAPSPPAASPPQRPSVTLDFMPEKATISFATLTVKGQLRLTNTGGEPARNMELRAGLISAGEQQTRAISAFHSASPDIKSEALGDANCGETIAMSMELSVPLTEMQSFAMGEQKLMVPIMVANLVYRDSGGGSEVSRIACMIGREANPPVPKMGALRLDLGPRSFASLGQRLINA